MENRVCSICGNTFPLDRDHFRWRTQDGKGYFTAECLLCRKNERKRARKRRDERRKAGLQKVEQVGVEKFLKSVTTGGSNIPHSAELIERVFDYFGGVSGFSAVMVKQYWDSPPGGSARNRLLETMCRLVSKNVDQGGAKKPVSLWTEDELEQELAKRLEQAVTVVTGTITYVEEEKAVRRISPQDAEAASDIAAAIASYRPEPDAVPARQHQGTPGGTEGAETRGPAALSPQPKPGSDPRLPGE